MVTSENGTGRSGLAVVGRVLAGLVSLAAGVVFALSAWVAISSRFAPAEQDLHGYGLLFGSILAVAAALVMVLVLPLAARRGARGRAYAISLACFMLVLVLLVVSVVTA